MGGSDEVGGVGLLIESLLTLHQRTNSFEDRSRGHASVNLFIRVFSSSFSLIRKSKNQTPPQTIENPTMSQSWKKPILTLPDDVVFDILARLPVKSLIRFRCVSKSWTFTITNPVFITTHLNQARILSLKNSNNNGYLLYTRLPVELLSGKELCSAVRNSDRTLTQICKSEIPFSGCRIIGYCNGLFCLGNHRVINLWNPSIRKFKSFRLMPWLTRPHNRFAVGIAYDSRNDDHKIVRMVSFQGFIGVIALPAVAEVYTLSTDSWRRIMISVDSLSGYIDDIDESPCVFFNGALHCLAKVGDYKFILSFDINDESFREIMLPGNYLNRSDRHFEQLVVFKGSLALIVFVEGEDGERDICHIWVMREYGVVNSWTEKSVPMENVGQLFGCTENGELLFKKFGTGLVSLDPASLNEQILGIKNSTWVTYTPNFLESLVLFDGVNL